jgi:uncharacterized protein YjiS (DUF1127 family)
MLQSTIHPLPAGNRSADLYSFAWHKAGHALVKVARTLALWFERSKQRQDLAELDDHLLKDIGISREEAVHESCVAFWR